MKQVLIIQRKKKQSQKCHGSSRFAARRQKNNRRKLSDDLESSVSVTEVSEGSVIIDIELGDLEALDTLFFMSDTGHLSYKIQT